MISCLSPLRTFSNCSLMLVHRACHTIPKQFNVNCAISNESKSGLSLLTVICGSIWQRPYYYNYGVVTDTEDTLKQIHYNCKTDWTSISNSILLSYVTDICTFFKRFTGLDILHEKMSNLEAIAQLESNAQVANDLVQEIYSKLAVLQNCNPEMGKEVQNLLEQNKVLKEEVDKWKEMLILRQIRNGGNPIVRDPKLVERSSVAAAVKQEAPSPPKETSAPEAKASPAPAAPTAPQPGKKGKKEGGGGAQKEAKPKAPAAPAAEDDAVDIGRLDLRIGLIKECTRHPDADSLYVEKIDVGEANVRTVISGLVKHVPLDAMQNRMVVVLCNLKPSKMRGISSEAMVMCASTPEKVEILTPPAGSTPGDTIEVEGIVRRPDAVLNPKKKIFETVAPDLKTNGSNQATYKGTPWNVPGKGIVTSESLCNVNIK